MLKWFLLYVHIPSKDSSQLTRLPIQNPYGSGVRFNELQCLKKTTIMSS